jgi:site-specific DNA recombinase
MKEQVDGFSLDAQEGNITRYVENHGWELIQIYVDAGISAKKGSRRPALEHLMRDAQARKFDVVIVDKIDRFYRHLNGLLSSLDLLNSYGVSFVSVQEQLDFTTPWGKLMLTVLGTLAEIYLDNLRQETKKGKLQKARQGQWLGEMPFGYCNGLCSHCKHPNGENYCPDLGKPDKGDGKYMLPHPVESQVVKLVFSWYATGDITGREIARKLNSTQISLPDGKSVLARCKGHPGRSDPHAFGRDVIRDMLQRITYTGKFPYYGVGEDGRHRKRCKPQIVLEGKHPALVDEATFNLAQDMRLLHGAAFVKKFNRKRIYPLTGILRCSLCGGSMRGSSHDTRTPNPKYYYADANRLDTIQKCGQRLVRAERIEAQVVQWLRRIVSEAASPETLDAAARLNESEIRLKRASDLYLAGQIDRETYELETRKHADISESLHADTLRAKMASISDIQPQLDRWEALSQFERKRLLRLTIERAFCVSAFNKGLHGHPYWLY